MTRQLRSLYERLLEAGPLAPLTHFTPGPGSGLFTITSSSVGSSPWSG